MRLRALPSALVIALATFSAPGPGVAAAAPVRLGSVDFLPCTLATTGQPQTVAARCASLRMPEDRARPSARSIDIAIAWVPSTSKRPRPDPVLFIAGGPGQSALESFPMLADAFQALLRQRDVILVDQRGTGRSHLLACPRTMADQSTLVMDVADAATAKALASACLAEIHDADVRLYTTTTYVEDIEAVRRALAIRSVNLVGVSYGSRVALEYLRRQPAHVRTAVLDGVVPPSLRLGAEHARNLEAVIDAQFRRCDMDATCREKFGSPRLRLDELLARLKAHPQKVSYHDPLTNETREDELTAEAVASVVRLHAYAPQLFAMLPMLLAEAADGHYEALMAQSRMVEQLVGEQISLALQLSVSCTEDAPGLVADPADRQTLLGTEFVDFLQAQCSAWPRGETPADFHDALTSVRPVLLLSGELDPVTPPRYGEAVARTLPQSRHLALRGQGHGVLEVGCTPRLVAQFVENGDAQHLDTKCLDALTYAPPFAGAYGWDP